MSLATPARPSGMSSGRRIGLDLSAIGKKGEYYVSLELETLNCVVFLMLVPIRDKGDAVA